MLNCYFVIRGNGPAGRTDHADNCRFAENCRADARDSRQRTPRTDATPPPFEKTNLPGEISVIRDDHTNLCRTGPSNLWPVNVREKRVMRNRAMSRRTILEAGACVLGVAAGIPQIASAHAETGLSPKSE